MRGIEVALIGLSLLGGVGCGALVGIPGDLIEDVGAKDAEGDHAPRTDAGLDSGEAGLPGSAAIWVSSSTLFQMWCAVTVSGDVECWGDDFNGMLGNGKPASYILPPWTPSKVISPLPPAKQVSVGITYVCALTRTDSVWCWGWDPDGELGNGKTETYSSTPVQVGIEGVVSLSAGGDVTCAVKDDHTVWCWGWGAQGELGQPAEADGAAPPDALVPKKVPDLLPATSVSVGEDDSACAVLENGFVECWGGFFGSGDQGNGTTKVSWTPVLVTGVSNVTAVSVGQLFACALTQGGDVYCWGHGGKLNDIVGNLTAVQVCGFSDVTAISAGDSVVCALERDSSVFCLGDGEDGDLGSAILREGDSVPSPAPPDGGPTPQWPLDQSSAPVQVQLSERATSISTGNAPCAVTTSGHVECWGTTCEIEMIPSRVTNVMDAVSVSIGGYDDSSAFACAVTPGLSGEAQCWGANGHDQLGSTLPLTQNSNTAVKTNFGDQLTGLSAGTHGDFACALYSGQVYCWGDDTTGQLGNGTTEWSSGPVEVKGMPLATAVSAGDASACAISTAGDLYCWGHNGHGQLGNNSHADTAVVTVPILSGVLAVSVGTHFACALLGDATVDCWGQNIIGEVGNGSMNGDDVLVPTPVSGLTGVTRIAAGGTSACAIITGGAIECWGDDSSGQLGDGASTGFTQSFTPVPSAITAGATQVAVGIFNACAVVSEKVSCWGDFVTGDGNWIDRSTVLSPVSISTLTHVTDIAVGYLSACAVQGGDVYCWGYNSVGQLGNGGPMDWFVPTRIKGFP
jgi:alpha-tubulin suppressor-like RCC1 family protein